MSLASVARLALQHPHSLLIGVLHLLENLHQGISTLLYSREASATFYRSDLRFLSVSSITTFIYFIFC